MDVVLCGSLHVMDFVGQLVFSKMRLFGQILFAFLFFGCNWQSKDLAKVKIHNDKIIVNSMTMHESTHLVFNVINEGKSNLIIKNVQTSCDCMVSDWTRKPVLTGDTAFVHVEFTPRAVGSQSQLIVFESNTDPPFNVLSLQANVLKDSNLVQQDFKN